MAERRRKRRRETPGANVAGTGGQAEPPPRTSKPLLSLDTLVERRYVKIDGGDYELLSPKELGLIEYHRIGRQVGRVEDLVNKTEDLSEDDNRALHSTLDSLCRLILLAPDEVQKRLGDHHRIGLVFAFSGLLATAVKGAVPGAEAVAAPSTGESRSPS